MDIWCYLKRWRNKIKQCETKLAETSWYECCRGIKVLLPEAFWIWSISQKLCDYFFITFFFFQLTPLSSLMSPKLLKKLLVWHLILCSSFFSRMCRGFFFFFLLFFSFMQSTLATERECWRGPRLLTVKADDMEKRGHAMKMKQADTRRQGK